MPVTNVLVLDDEPEVAGRWSEAVRKAIPAAECRSVSAELFNDLVQRLDARRAATRDQEPWRHDSEIDDYDLIIVDYDLLRFSAADGHRLCYLFRCFSRSGFLVLLNAEGAQNTFNLNLSPASYYFSNSFADLLIPGQQLSNPGLWASEFAGYRPWYWPIIPDALAASQEAAKRLLPHLDDPVLTYLGLDGVIDRLPLAVVNFLSPATHAEAGRIEELSIRQFVANGRGGLAPKDKTADDQSVAQIASSRLTTLLNQILLPSQDVITDLPHIISRYVSIMKASQPTIDALNQVCSRGTDDLDEIVKLEIVGPHRLHIEPLTWRPVWLWPRLRVDANILEVKAPWETKELPFVFCEDLSQFLPVELARDFVVTDLETEFPRRYVAQQSEAVYVELGLKNVDATEPQHLGSVLYEPSKNFAL